MLIISTNYAKIMPNSSKSYIRKLIILDLIQKESNYAVVMLKIEPEGSYAW